MGGLGSGSDCWHVSMENRFLIPSFKQGAAHRTAHFVRLLKEASDVRTAVLKLLRWFKQLLLSLVYNFTPKFPVVPICVMCRETLVNDVSHFFMSHPWKSVNRISGDLSWTSEIFPKADFLHDTSFDHLLTSFSDLKLVLNSKKKSKCMHFTGAWTFEDSYYQRKCP